LLPGISALPIRVVISGSVAVTGAPITALPHEMFVLHRPGAQTGVVSWMPSARNFSSTENRSALRVE
jgi:hypothetical protein